MAQSEHLHNENERLSPLNPLNMDNSISKAHSTGVVGRRAQRSLLRGMLRLRR